MSTELAWAAGFFDGEGTTYASVKKRGRALILQVKQAEPETLHRFMEAVGFGRVLGPYPNAGAGYWHFQITSRNEVIAALASLWPYLSCHKKAQAMKALVSYSTAVMEKIA